MVPMIQWAELPEVGSTECAAGELGFSSALGSVLPEGRGDGESDELCPTSGKKAVSARAKDCRFGNDAFDAPALQLLFLPVEVTQPLPQELVSASSRGMGSASGGGISGCVSPEDETLSGQVDPANNSAPATGGHPAGNPVTAAIRFKEEPEFPVFHLNPAEPTEVPQQGSVPGTDCDGSGDVKKEVAVGRDGNAKWVENSHANIRLQTIVPEISRPGFEVGPVPTRMADANLTAASSPERASTGIETREPEAGSGNPAGDIGLNQRAKENIARTEGSQSAIEPAHPGSGVQKELAGLTTDPRTGSGSGKHDPDREAATAKSLPTKGQAGEPGVHPGALAAAGAADGLAAKPGVQREGASLPRPSLPEFAREIAEAPASAKLLDRLDRQELHFRWDAPTIGPIEVRTSLEHDRVGAVVTVANAHLRDSLNADINALARGLSERSLELSYFSAETGGSRDGPRDFTAQQALRPGRDREDMPESNPVHQLNHMTRSHAGVLDLRV